LYVANIVMYFFFTMLYILTPFYLKLIKLLFFHLFCYPIIDSGENKDFQNKWDTAISEFTTTYSVIILTSTREIYLIQ